MTGDTDRAVVVIQVPVEIQLMRRHRDLGGEEKNQRQQAADQWRHTINSNGPMFGSQQDTGQATR